MQGTIEVERVMGYSRRMQGTLEWIALKEYWKADWDDKPVVMALYFRVLPRALEKYYQSRHY